MEEVVKPLLVEGAVPLILELLKLVRTVKDRGAGAVDRCDESLALLLLRLLCASRKAQESLLGVEGQSTSGLQVNIPCIRASMLEKSWHVLAYGSPDSCIVHIFCAVFAVLC